ncbi:MAG: hypothetical protein CVV27_09480, partial [Candidatus Melainabacteria bacterium HGW-Melainabacteria-1]
MLHLINWEAVRTKRARYLLLDLAMLVLALVHLLLLLFDATYFQMRPYYVRYVPGLASSYDQLKGMQPHRDTTRYQQEALRLFEACARDGTVPEARQRELIRLSDQLVEEDPFARANLSGRLEMIKAEMRSFTGIQNSSKQAFVAFWEPGCADVARREAFFRAEIVPHLEL